MTQKFGEIAEDHPDILKVISAFGVLRREQNNYPEAERLLRQALDGRQVKLGPDHPHTLQSMHELAVLYAEQDQHPQAADLLAQLAEGRLDKLGNKHPHTQESLTLLIDLNKALNKPEEADKWRAKIQRKIQE